MKVKDLVLKLDNSSTKFKFYEVDEKTLVVVSDVDKMKKVYKENTTAGIIVGKVFDRNIKKWFIDGKGESIKVILTD